MNELGVASLVVLAVVSVLWTVMMVIVTLELRRASGRLQEFIRSLELELKPTIQQTREAIRTLNRVAQGAAEGRAGARHPREARSGRGQHPGHGPRGAFGSRLAVDPGGRPFGRGTGRGQRAVEAVHTKEEAS